MSIEKPRNRFQALSLEITENEIVHRFNGSQRQYQYPRHMTKPEVIRRNSFSRSQTKISTLSSNNTDANALCCKVKFTSKSNFCLQSV